MSEVLWKKRLLLEWEKDCDNNCLADTYKDVLESPDKISGGLVEDWMSEQL